MAKLNVKVLKEKITKMLSAWLEGAKDGVFMGVSRSVLDAKCKEAETLENEIEELSAQMKIKEDELTVIYTAMNQMRVDVGNGVKGDVNFGDDSALYGAMGFVRKSERKSGLTRKKRPVS